MSSWVRRTNCSGKQYRCGNCWGVIADEVYFLMTDGCKLCIDCPPEEDGEYECTI